jgi:hypothetical protein
VKNRAPVPCNGCTVCCQNELLFLHPEEGDVVADYLTQRAWNPLTQQAGFALQQKPNGDCVYLGPSGCSIWERAPLICRHFDCRALLARIGGRPAQRRALKTGMLSKELFDAARAANARTP